MRLNAKVSAALLAAVLSLCGSPAFATPQLHYATGLWNNPDESGWGLNLFHQGDTLFGALFVYGTDGQPHWYVASGLASGDDGPLHDKGNSFSGALYEAAGPWFGGPFDPAKVTRRQVGTMRVDVGDNSGIVEYSIDGVTVSKPVRPYSFRAADLSGRYVGYLYQPASTSGSEIRDPVAMTIQDNGSAVHIAASSDIFGSCSYDGAHGQNGQISTASGTFSACGARGSGPFAMAVDPTPDGLTGTFAGSGITSSWGRIALSRRDAGVNEGNGWRTDLWFPPGESGWGVNVVEQGDTIFATLFVYDAQGRSHWYVASALARSAPRPDGTSLFSGPLYESTGPYFGAAFNPSAVTRRQVGTMSFDVRDRSTALLTYSVDGVQVTKNVSRYAFRKNNLSGTYIGHITAADDDPGGSRSEAQTIAIEDTDNGFVMRANCTYSAPAPAQYGEQRTIAGTYSCPNGTTGPFAMQNAFVTFNGFTASFVGAGIVKGHIEGVRLVAAPSRFSFAPDNAVSAPNGVGQVSIQRTGGVSGSVTISYVLQGDGCTGTPADGSVTFGDGDAGSKAISVPMRASGQCDVIMIPPAAPAEVGSHVASVTVVPIVAGCPAPSNVITNRLVGIGNPLLQRQKSGQTVFMTLPATPSGSSSGSIVFSESAGGAFTPQPVTLEVSINKCPGIIDTDTGNFCNVRSTNGNFNSITFLSKATDTINSGNANQRGYCWAGDATQYYINARWTYSSCPSGVELCGFAIQLNQGPF